MLAEEHMYKVLMRDEKKYLFLKELHDRGAAEIPFDVSLDLLEEIGFKKDVDYKVVKKSKLNEEQPFSFKHPIVNVPIVVMLREFELKKIRATITFEVSR